MNYQYRVVQIFVYLAFLISASACATTNDVTAASPKDAVQFSYNQHNKMLSLQGDICRYGKSSKSELPFAALNASQQFVQQQPDAFINQIKDINKGMLGNRLQVAELSVFYLLKVQDMQFDYRFVGNQVCANYQAAIPLDFAMDFTDFIALNAPSHYHFVANPAQTKDIINLLHNVYPNLPHARLSRALPNSPHLLEQQKINDELSLLRFNYTDFKQALQQQQSSVYTSGDALWLEALNQYLQNNGFTLTDDKSAAFWQVEVRSVGQPQSIGAFVIDYQNNQTGVSAVFKNDNSLLSGMTTATKQQQLRMLYIYLELQSFAERLK